MPNMGRVLSFPSPSSAGALAFPREQEPSLTREQATAQATSFFSTPMEARSPEAWGQLLDPEVLVVVISLLQGKMNREPLATSQEAVRLFELISKSEIKIGVFDEPDFFSGEI